MTTICSGKHFIRFFEKFLMPNHFKNPVFFTISRIFLTIRITWGTAEKTEIQACGLTGEWWNPRVRWAGASRRRMDHRVTVTNNVRKLCRQIEDPHHFATAIFDKPPEKRQRMDDTTGAAPASLNQDVPEKQCVCGGGACVVKTSNTARNPGRRFYKCPGDDFA